MNKARKRIITIIISLLLISTLVFTIDYFGSKDSHNDRIKHLFKRWDINLKVEHYGAISNIITSTQGEYTNYITFDRNETLDTFVSNYIKEHTSKRHSNLLDEHLRTTIITQDITLKNLITDKTLDYYTYSIEDHGFTLILLDDLLVFVFYDL